MSILLAVATAVSTTKAAPWWAVPIATIGGALIGGLASFFGTQAGIERSQRHAAANLRAATDEQARLQMDAESRKASTDFLARVTELLDMILYNEDIDWGKIINDEEATLVRVQVYCEADIAKLATELFDAMAIFALRRTDPDKNDRNNIDLQTQRSQLGRQRSQLTDLIRARIGKVPLQLNT